MLALRSLLLPRVVAWVGSSLFLTGRVALRRLLLPGTLSSLLHLLPSQLIVLAGRSLRLTASLIPLRLVSTVTALATLTLIAAWVLARTLVWALLILAIPVIP
ncbi:MAG: hypothetical protein WKF63_07610 [Thermomicrobiales bacterium]